MNPLPLPTPAQLLRPVTPDELARRFSPEFAASIRAAGRLITAQPGDEWEWIVVNGEGVVMRFPETGMGVALGLIRGLGDGAWRAAHDAADRDGERQRLESLRQSTAEEALVSP